MNNYQIFYQIYEDVQDGAHLINLLDERAEMQLAEILEKATYPRFGDSVGEVLEDEESYELFLRGKMADARQGALADAEAWEAEFGGEPDDFEWLPDLPATPAQPDIDEADQFEVWVNRTDPSVAWVVLQGAETPNDTCAYDMTGSREACEARTYQLYLAHADMEELEREGVDREGNPLEQPPAIDEDDEGYPDYFPLGECDGEGGFNTLEQF